MDIMKKNTFYVDEWNMFSKTTDYWKSNDRKFCDFCKCWITDNKPSVAFHENGRRHKANVAKRISEISKNSVKEEKEKKKMDQELRKMEEAALKSYASDISLNADLTARNISAVVGAVNMVTVDGQSSTIPAIGPRPPGAQIDPLLPPGDLSDDDDGASGSSRRTVKKPSTSINSQTAPSPEDSMWVEAKSPEGYTYYWNVKTNESIWEPPKEGYMPINEYNRINRIAVAQQEITLKQESKEFQASAPEIVARYNREKLKLFRRQDPKEEKRKKEERETFKTEEELLGAQQIGEWQTVIKEEEKQVDLQLPAITQPMFMPAYVPELKAEPPTKKFKEKTIVSLEPDFTAGSSCTFKKRKIAGRGNARQRLDVD